MIQLCCNMCLEVRKEHLENQQNCSLKETSDFEIKLKFKFVLTRALKYQHSRKKKK